MLVMDRPALKLAELLQEMEILATHGLQEQTPVYGISQDSRRVKPGYLFVALKGEEKDGHDYILEALRKGAIAIIAEKGPPSSTAQTVAWIQVRDSRLALARLAAGLFRHPSRELVLLGVTGTSGKTTVTSMLQEICKTAGYNTGLIGTVQISYNGQSRPARLTTPDALELQELLRLMVDSGVSHAAMEVSSHGLAQKRVEALNFRGAVFTNISANHLDFHKNLQDYAAAKWKLASLVEPGGFLLLNGDDPYWSRREAPAQNVDRLLLGSHAGCDLRMGNTVLSKRGSTFRLTLQNPALSLKYPSLSTGVWPLQLPLLGRHNVFNGAAAAAAALLAGIGAEKVQEGLAGFRGVERRLQLHRFGDFQVLDDTAMSPGSINAVFTTIEELGFDSSALVVVYAIRGRRGTRVNADNGRTLAHWVNRLKIRHFFSTSSVNYVDAGNKVLPEEQEAFWRGARAGGVSPRHFADLEEAVTQALKVTVSGSTLVLLGAQGMDEGLKLVRAASCSFKR